MNNLIKGGLLFLGGAAVGATIAEQAKKRAEEYSAKIKENSAAANSTEQPVNTNTDGQ